MDIRRGMRGVGKTLIAAGTLILLFVVYQLWGTGLAESRSQDRLTKRFSQQLSAPTPSSPEGPPPDAPAPPPAPEGEAVALIRIPKIGVEKAVVEGVGLPELKKGPGHFPTTPMPGQPGNSALAGHRTTYGAPFFRLDEVRGGDQVLVTTRQGRFSYEVTENKVVGPDETSVLEGTPENRLTLTTCEPRFSAAKRLVVVAALRGEAATTAPEPPAGEPSPPSVEAGLSGVDSGNGPVVAWGAAVAVVALLVYLLARVWRPWAAYAVGAPVFLVVLFFFFENFSRLLPANY